MKSTCSIPVQIQQLGVFQFFSFTPNGEEVMMDSIAPYSAKHLQIQIDGSFQCVKKARIVYVDPTDAYRYQD